jgi:hypothetical protein
MIKTYSFIFIFPFLCFAKSHTIEKSDGEIVFETEDTELSQRKFFGADLWFTGDVIEGKRNVMSIIYNSKDVKLAGGVSEAEYSIHKSKMKKFADERGYSKVIFEPYRYIKKNAKLGYHNFVWSYDFGGNSFVEESYYVECDNLFFISKATTNSSSKKDRLKFKKIIEGAKCKSF